MSKKLNLLNKKFNKLLVKQYIGKKKTKHLWLCQCDCGNTIKTITQNLCDGRTKSCGCIKYDNFKDRSGEQIGNLTILEFAGRIKNKRTVLLWKCQCSCGTIKIIRADALRKNNTQSCGCLRSSSKILNKSGAAKNKIYAQYIKQANDRDIVFDISKSHFLYLISQPCYYCDDPPSNKISLKRKNHKELFIYNGIDRLNNDIPYIKSNCVPCCKLCNWWKRNMKLENFIKHAKKISLFNL